MGKGFKKTVTFLFFLVAGITAGTVISRLCADVKSLDWLSYTMPVGIDTGAPAVLDLIIFKIAFGFTLSVNIAQIICIILALIVYNKTCKGI